MRPIDADRAIEWFKPYLHTGEPIPADVVIEDLRSMPTLTPPNEPLTIEQLRGMVGRWVWVVVKYEHCTCDGWALVTTPAFLSYLDQTLPVDFYGRQFTAYLRPPEGEKAQILADFQGQD